MRTVYEHKELNFETTEELLKSIGYTIDGKTFTDIAIEAGHKNSTSVGNPYDLYQLSQDVYFAVTELFNDAVDQCLENDLFQVSTCKKLVTGIYISVRLEKETGYLTVGFSTNPFHKFKLEYTMMDIKDALFTSELSSK